MENQNLFLYQVSNYGDGSYFSSYLQFCLIVATSKEEALSKAKEKLDFEKHNNFHVEIISSLSDIENGQVLYAHEDSDY